MTDKVLCRAIRNLVEEAEELLKMEIATRKKEEAFARELEAFLKLLQRVNS